MGPWTLDGPASFDGPATEAPIQSEKERECFLEELVLATYILSIQSFLLRYSIFITPINICEDIFFLSLSFSESCPSRIPMYSLVNISHDRSKDNAMMPLKRTSERLNSCIPKEIRRSQSFLSLVRCFITSSPSSARVLKRAHWTAMVV